MFDGSNVGVLNPTQNTVIPGLVIENLIFGPKHRTIYRVSFVNIFFQNFLFK